MTAVPATTTVRFARPEDAGTIVAFIRGLAEFEHEPLEQVHVTEADIVRDGFGPRPLARRSASRSSSRTTRRGRAAPASTWRTCS